jgi:RimJ/RimL family protein N-acetyltransferase
VNSKVVCETGRLTLRRLDDGDAAFILRLVNDADWLRYIGDRNVKSLDDARNYIQTGPVEMYARMGYGLYAVVLAGGEPIGLCGLIKRDSLEHADLGFAFLPEYRGRGYAFEAARATLAYARNVLGLPRILAVTTLDNEASGGLLTKLGFRLDRRVRLEPADVELNLYTITA